MLVAVGGRAQVAIRGQRPLRQVNGLEMNHMVCLRTALHGPVELEALANNAAKSA